MTTDDHIDENAEPGGRTVGVRVFTRWLDDPTECPFVFDLVLERSSGAVCGSWPVFGATEIDGPTPHPFVLDASGRLRFDSADRRWRTDLRNIRVAVGRRFRVWWTDSEFGDYEVVKIAALGEKSARLRFPSTRSDL